MNPNVTITPITVTKVGVTVGAVDLALAGKRGEINFLWIDSAR